MINPKPEVRPANPRFSSGPCPKPPGWAPSNLPIDLLGRSHRSLPGRARLERLIDLTREILGIPDDYRVGIVPASDTGAVEMALWSLLGCRPVDVLAWESFGKAWLNDVVSELKLDGVNRHVADYGLLPDLAAVDFSNDVVFTWNGTTSGVRVPDGAFIPDDRGGLTICDATSAVFAQELPWDKLDVTTFSWQKALGGEAAHGMLILSPRAAGRLESWTPPWPVPKVFRLTRAGRLNESIFRGATINTPSMLCVEDCIAALEWAATIGGLDAMIGRANANLAAVTGFVENRDWLDFLAFDPATRSNTSVCLKFVHPGVAMLDPTARARFARGIVSRLEEEAAAFDIGSYRDAPPGLRIWTGSTVETSSLEMLFPWLDWAFALQLNALRHD
ncbi:MAG: phosphoserine transaminase [Rhodobacteraceae bacterium]|nr:phosphoserine transaminase [Paracoccaceae bacterium]MCY4136755.1 phosphoserine transaminase [Paracoccaceae bacterium]